MKGGTDYNSLSSMKKKELAKEVVASVKAMGGRFLKHASPNKSEGVGAMKYYIEVPDNVAIDKVKQGFRHQIKAFDCNKNGLHKKIANQEVMAKRSEKPKHSPPPLFVGGMENAKSGTATGGNGKGTMGSSKLLLTHDKRFLPTGAEKWSLWPASSMIDTSTCPRPDFMVQGMQAPYLLLAPPHPLSTMRLPTRSGDLDGLLHSQSRSALLYRPDQRWLAPLSRMITATMPAPFLKRGAPQQQHLFEQISSWTNIAGNTTGLEWDPCVLNLLALRHERPNSGTVLQNDPLSKCEALDSECHRTWPFTNARNDHSSS